MNKTLSDSQKRQIAGVCLALAALVVFVFGPAVTFDFVNFDDNEYVYASSQISSGLTWDGIKWVLTHPHSSNWHPLTSLSHMLDCQIYGLNPFGHHLINILLHAATALALFLVLRSMTGSIWRSACVAALFAAHPLRAESVAWVSERKDVLSGLFFMLTLGAYLRYVRRPFSTGRYLSVFVLFACGLLSKSMLVTLPFVLLLLDVWPLQRFSSESPKRLVVEKIPLLILSAIFCGITVWAQQRAVTPADTFSFPWRIQNALFSYLIYLRQLILPVGLAVPYPADTDGFPVWQTVCALVLLGGISLAAVRQIRTKPFLFTGWFWYLGMLVPVIGILQVGGQAHADRYTYLPQIGLGILIVWVVGDWAVSRPRRIAVSAATAAVIISLGMAARIQSGIWRDGTTLWTRALACTENNFIAHSNLGTLLFMEGKTDEAIAQFEKSLEIDNSRAEVFNNLAAAYAEAGRLGDAVNAAERALTLAKQQSSPEVIESIRRRLNEYRARFSAD